MRREHGGRVSNFSPVAISITAHALGTYPACGLCGRGLGRSGVQRHFTKEHPGELRRVRVDRFTFSDE